MEKWCVLRTAENAKVLNKWCNQHYSNRNFSSRKQLYIHSDKWDGVHYTDGMDHYPLLSFEEWRDRILNSPKIAGIESYLNMNFFVICQTLEELKKVSEELVKQGAKKFVNDSIIKIVEKYIQKDGSACIELATKNTSYSDTPYIQNNPNSYKLINFSDLFDLESQVNNTYQLY